jgi:2-oxoisovalerate dehydrogenase E1 component
MSNRQYTLDNTDKDTLTNWYSLLTLGRQLDEKAPNYLKQALGWSYHAPYAGHDGIQLAIGLHFNREKDFLFPYYRDMLTTLSAGLTPEEIILNGISKADDPSSGGRHMSNHFAKPEWHIENVSSATGNHILHAAGVARSIKIYNGGGVAISSQGESSTSEGYVFEAINGASKEGLPAIFVFQDNQYGISVPQKDQSANRRAAENFRGIKHLKIMYCDGKNVFNSMNTMYEAKKHALENSEPVIVHANCVRIHSHSNSDRHELYRDENERHCVRLSDPLERFRIQLIHSGKFTEEELTGLDKAAKKEISAAHKKTLKASDPDPKTIFDFVVPEPYKAEKYPDGLHDSSKGEKIKLIQALNQTLKAEFRHNPDTFLYGQDMANKDKGGIFNVSKGMQQEFGKIRVLNAPIAEDFILGTANGMTRFDEKIRVIVEGAEFADYFWPAMEQLVDSSHDYWRSNGKFSPNVTVRLASGGYIGGGLYHSQSIESVLTSFPGIRVVYPTFADDAAGLLRTSIRSKGLTLYLEPKALYNDPASEAVVPDDFEVPFGKARIRREGTDLSIITYGNTLPMSITVADKIKKETGKSIEVLDLRSLLPLDEEAILKTVTKTNRVMVVHEDKVFSGFGGEVAALITEKAFEKLDAPVKRVGATFTPIGFNRILENAILPNVEKIETAVRELLEY